MEPAPLIFTDCQPVYHLVKLQFQDPIIIVAYLCPFFFFYSFKILLFSSFTWFVELLIHQYIVWFNIFNLHVIFDTHELIFHML